MSVYRPRYPRKPINRPTPSLPPLPKLATADGHVLCPECGWVDTIQHLEYRLIWWNLDHVADDGTIVFNGDWDYGEEAKDQVVSCWNCAAEWDWASVEKVDFA